MQQLFGHREALQQLQEEIAQALRAFLAEQPVGLDVALVGEAAEYLVQVLGATSSTSSHLLATLAEANCLVVIPEEIEQVGTGEVVDVAFLAQRG